MTLSSTVSGSNALNVTDSSGGGTLNLTASNTYTGGTNLNAGTLNVQNSSALGTTALAINGGMLQFGAASLNLANAVGLNVAISTIDTQGNTSTLSGAISGTGALAKIGTGTLILNNGSNSYSGGTYLDAGILNVNSDAALGNTNGALTFNGGALQAGGTITSARGITLNSAGGTFDTTIYSSTLSGAIGGAGALTVADSGVGGSLVLSDSNNYSGGTNLDAGTLNVQNSSSPRHEHTRYEWRHAAVRSGQPQSRQRRTLNVAISTIDTHGIHFTLSGAISGTGALAKIGTGTLILNNGSNSYSGGTNLDAGTLNIQNSSALGTNTLAMNGGTLQFGLGGLTLANAVALNNVGISTIDTQSNTSTLSGAISGTGALAKIGTGTLTLNNGSNSYSGGTYLDAGITQRQQRCSPGQYLRRAYL